MPTEANNLQKGVHNIKRALSCGDVLPRMEKWAASLNEPDKDTKTELADVTKANCLRNTVPNELYIDLIWMSHVVSYDEVKRYIVFDMRSCAKMSKGRAAAAKMSPRMYSA